MPAPTIRPAADPLDAMDRSTDRGVDAAMGRQDRADLPGERSDQPRPDQAGDVYLDAARELVEGEREPEQARRDDDREAERVADGDPDLVGIDEDGDDIESVAPPRGADGDDPIDETERAGDDAV